MPHPLLRLTQCLVLSLVALLATSAASAANFMDLLRRVPDSPTRSS